MGKPKRKRPFGKPKRRWEDNFEIDLKEIRWGPWTGLIWFRIGPSIGLFLNAVMDIQIPHNAGNFLTG